MVKIIIISDLKWKWNNFNISWSNKCLTFHKKEKNIKYFFLMFNVNVVHKLHGTNYVLLHKKKKLNVIILRSEISTKEASL